MPYPKFVTGKLWDEFYQHTSFIQPGFKTKVLKQKYLFKTKIIYFKINIMY